MSEWYKQFRAWGDALHAELVSDYGVGLGDLEYWVSLGDLYEAGAGPEEALTAAGMCYCDHIEGICETCKAEQDRE